MNNELVTKIIERWSNPVTRPKFITGALVRSEYDDHVDDGEPSNGVGMRAEVCMCAQGDVLHVFAGLSVKDLYLIDQCDADKQVAKLLGISFLHSVLLRWVNDTKTGAPETVLTNPEEHLGSNAQFILRFWRYIDTLPSNFGYELETLAYAKMKTIKINLDEHLVCDDTGLGSKITNASLTTHWDPESIFSRVVYEIENYVPGAPLEPNAFWGLELFGFATPEEIPVT